jgi:hypothetical protein
LVKRFFLIAILAVAFSSRAQNLPPPNLHMPAPLPGATTPAQGGTAAAPQAPVGNLPSIKISASIDPIKIYQAEFFEYLIELSWQKQKENCELEFKLPEVPKAEGVKATGSEFESDNTLKAENETVKRVYKFRYYPSKSGKSSIGQADFEYRCLGTQPYAKISAPPFPVEILPKRFKFSDLQGNRNFQIFLAAVLLAAIAIVVYFVLSGRRKKAAQKPVEVVITPEQKALELLKSADQYRIAGRYPDYFLGLERVLRLFLEEKYSIRWSGRERLVEEVGKAIAPELGSAVDQLLIISDRVKFAGVEPASGELDRSYEAVRRVIEFKNLQIAGGGK